MILWDDQEYKRCFILSLFKLKSVKTIILKTCMDNLMATWLKVQLDMYFRGHAYFDNLFYQFSASLFPLYVEEKTMWRKTWKNSNNNNINTTGEAPWNFQNVCMILYLFITSLNPSKMGLLQTDENLTDIMIHKYSWKEHHQALRTVNFQGLCFQGLRF